MPEVTVEFVSRFLRIVILDMVLSGDNAVVIALATLRLPPRQRRWAVFFGAFTAIALRVAATAIAAWMLQVPFLRGAGGLILTYIAAKLLVEDEEAGARVREGRHLWEAIWTIALADFVMSFDNMLAVAAASGGHVGLLAFGLLLSMSIIIFGSQIISALMERFPILIIAGAGILGWTAGELFAQDPFVLRLIGESPTMHRAVGLIFTVFVIAWGKLWNARQKARGAVAAARDRGDEAQ